MSEQNFAPANPTNTPPVEPENFTEALVGQGKKYETAEDAAKALYHSQRHIEKLEQEARERQAAFDAQSAEQKTVEQILAAIDAKTEQSPPSIQNGLTPPVEPTAPVEAPKEQDLEELVAKYVSEDRARRQTESNFNKAVSALDGKYGSREATNQAVAAKAAELGVGVTFLKELASSSPDGFLSVMGASSSNVSRPLNVPKDINATSLSKNTPNGPAQPRTARWYRELKASDPKQYQRLYPQLMKDLSDNPDKFYERV